MWAMLTASVPELARPTYSSMRFGFVPAARTRVGLGIRIGTLLSPSFALP
jgi:hypothetical protein